MTATPRVLVVDDDPDIRDLLAFTLGIAGYEIHTADDGYSALAVAGQARPDVVIVDWMMPKLDGIGVCLELRGDEQLCEVPVIMISARVDERDMTRGLAAGADDYLCKPFSPRELLRKVDSALAGAARRRDRAIWPLASGGYLG